MASCLSNTWKSWVKICSAINRFFERLFFKWAHVAGTHPIKVICIGVFIALALTAGFMRFNLQKQTERLYFPETSPSKDALERAEKSFPQKTKPDKFIVTMSNGRDSVLNEKAFKTALHIHERIMKETDIDGMCTKVGHPTPTKCLVLGALELFQYNASLISDASIKPTLLNALQNQSIVMMNGRTAEVTLNTLLGHLWYNSTHIEADGLRVMYFQVFPETDEVHEKVSALQKKMIEIFQSEEQKIEQANELKLYYMTGRSIDDAISESSVGDISLVVVSIALMCVFSTLVLISIRDPPSGHVIAGIVGIACIAFGTGSGFGLVILSGQYFVAFVGTLPFLVLGVGIDDMFIIIDALDALPSEVTGIERLQKTLSKVGASVTMTTITDVVAFAISSSSQFPAIRYFCFYAMTTILLTYVIIMTVFVAFLSIDIKRVESGRWDIIPCKITPNHVPWKHSLSSISRKVMRRWARLLMTTAAKVSVCFISLGLLAAGIYGTFQLEEKFDLKQLAPDGSYFITFQDKQREYFPIGYSVDIIMDNADFDYTNTESQQGYMYLDTICKDNKYMKNKTLNWMTALLHSQTYNSSLTFYQNLNIFLQKNPMYYTDLRFYPGSDNSRIMYSRMICYDKENVDLILQSEAMLQLREDVEKKSNISNNGVFPISLNYFYRENIVRVPPDTIQNLVLCAIAILVITTPYLVHPLVIFIVFCGFVSLVVELFALMFIWDVALNSVSMITSIMSIGFAVDYSAHVAHSYLLASGDTPEERMIEALETIGSSVFTGGFTTFLGILVMGFGQSEFFRIFFKIVLGIVVLGLLNGLVFLPVFLTLLVRTKINIADKNHVTSSKVSENNVNMDKIHDANGRDIVLKNANAVNAGCPG